MFQAGTKSGSRRERPARSRDAAEADAFEATRQSPRDGRGLHIGELAHAIDEVAREARAGGIGVAGHRQIQRRQLDAVRIEAGIHRAGLLERPHEQSGDDDEQEAERDLRDDERVPHPRTPGRRRRIVFQRRDDVGLRGLEGGSESRQHAPQSGTAPS